MADDPATRDLALLGRGCILSARDRAPESNQAFLEFDKHAADPTQHAAILAANPRVRAAIARALERNYLITGAAREAFPADLERWRRPGPLAPRKS